ncbi:MAG: hypothetical protein ACREBU_18655, partial [Nitrososphaera sp.]
MIDLETIENQEGHPTFNFQLMSEEEALLNYERNVDSRPKLEELKEDSLIIDMVLALEREHTFAAIQETEELRIYDENSGVFTAEAEA